ncbi:MAG: YkgJ family cysteine cluster protein [Treponema sp.]|jgi:Fe-S-cluster containining protein|nr:YkgJ family cysteine cluster protein [Treponema sp.]
MSLQQALFYAEGLRFSCTRCSTCCRYESGYVFLTEHDTTRLLESLQIAHTGFVETYCRWVPDKWGTEQLTLKEKSNYDCIFWKNGCSVYEARPLQCRTFPFWHSIMVSAKAWDAAARDCPGMGKGTLHLLEEIMAYLEQQDAENLVTRISNREVM